MKKQNQKPNTRRQFSAAEKSKILKLHLVEGQPISSVCDEFDLSPSRFYAWQAQLFEKADKVFDRNRGPKPSDRNAEIERLEAKVRQKDEVIAELMAEYLSAKKKIGENS